MASSSNWRDWVHHPELVTAMWPQMLASGIAPASCLALLGTCRYTRDAVLLEAPRAKLTMQLGTKNPPSAGPLLLLQASGRTQPTTLSLTNSTNPAPSSTSAAAPHAPFSHCTANSRARTLLSLPTLLAITSITRLDLTGVMVDDSLLLATRALPALTHLELRNIHLPSPTYELYDTTRLPQRLRTLHIELDPNWNAPLLAAWSPHMPAYSNLLTEFLLTNTIHDLIITTTRVPVWGQIPHRPDFTNHNVTEAFFQALGALSDLGLQVLSLQRLSMPQLDLKDNHVYELKRSAPQLEELQVCSVQTAGTRDVAVTWHTLRAHELDLNACCNLPLGGTQPLDISGRLWGPDTNGLLLDCINRLASPQVRRPVRLVGSGADGGTFVWDSRGAGTRPSHPVDLVTALSALQLSKAPVRRLDIKLRMGLDVHNLLQALQPLPSLTEVGLSPISWDARGTTQHDLLAKLPLHIERVRLDSFAHSLDDYDLFRRMANAVGLLPARQERPLKLCIVGVGPASRLWKSVERCRARGARGVVMEEVRVVSFGPGVVETQYQDAA